MKLCTCTVFRGFSALHPNMCVCGGMKPEDFDPRQPPTHETNVRAASQRGLTWSEHLRAYVNDKQEAMYNADGTPLPAAQRW